MSKRFVLDAWAVLALLQREEPAASRIKELLVDAENDKVELFMSMINLGEVYSRIGRARGRDQADETLETIRQLRLAVLPATDPAVLAAARLKIDHRISYADAFAVVAAAEQNAILATGDPELMQMRDGIKIEKLRRDGH